MEKFRQAYGWLRGEVEAAAPERIGYRVLERVHERGYLDRVSLDAGNAEGRPGLERRERVRLGLPAHPRLLERSALETAGTVAAMWAALEDGMAANLAGGTHHAFAGEGQGYCVLNDVAVAIAELRANGADPHVLIVDTDAHQGNGNHHLFARDGKVFTYSIHVGRNYPSRKVAGDCDVALPRWVEGGLYLEELAGSLAEVFGRTEPDLVFWISGADGHEADRFGQMRLTEGDMRKRDERVLGLCRDYVVPTVVVYGGGYNQRPGGTGWLHAQTIRVAAGYAPRR